MDGDSFSQLTNNRTKEKVLKFCQRRFRLNIKKNLFTVRVLRHWNRVPKGVVVPPSLKYFKDV